MEGINCDNITVKSTNLFLSLKIIEAEWIQIRAENVYWCLYICALSITMTIICDFYFTVATNDVLLCLRVKSLMLFFTYLNVHNVCIYALLWFALCAFDIFSEYLLFPIRIFVVEANTLHVVPLNWNRFNTFFNFSTNTATRVFTLSAFLLFYSLRISVCTCIFEDYRTCKVNFFFLFYWNVTITVFRTRILNRRSHQYVFSIFWKNKIK